MFFVMKYGVNQEVKSCWVSLKSVIGFCKGL